MKRLFYSKLNVVIFTILLIIPISFWITFQGNSCRKLQKHGFSYTIEGGFLSTWDYVSFYFFKDVNNAGKGPVIGGGPLKVICKDVTGDQLPEYIVRHRGENENQTILQVDIDSGTYHIYSTNWLKVNYPVEGFYADF